VETLERIAGENLSAGSSIEPSQGKMIKRQRPAAKRKQTLLKFPLRAVATLLFN
jgi:hypothetical protein